VNRVYYIDEQPLKLQDHEGWSWAGSTVVFAGTHNLYL